MTTAMKFPAVLAAGKASEEVVVTPASLLVCCTSEMAACACPNSPASNTKRKRAKNLSIRTRNAVAFTRRKLFNIGHPPEDIRKICVAGRRARLRIARKTDFAQVNEQAFRA